VVCGILGFARRNRGRKFTTFKVVFETKWEKKSNLRRGAERVSSSTAAVRLWPSFMQGHNTSSKASKEGGKEERKKKKKKMPMPG